MTVGISRRPLDTVRELRSMQDLSYRVWLHDPALLNFEASFGTLAWERGGIGRCRAFEREGRLLGWARLVPGYSRIRASGVRDDAPPSLVWQIDPQDVDPQALVHELLSWALQRVGASFTTAYNEPDLVARQVLAEHGFRPDPNEPFSGYLGQQLTSTAEPNLPGYSFITMVELDDLERRAEVHRLAWDGSSRSAADVRLTMDTWPYRPDLDFVAVAEDGSLASSAICWFDRSFDYGEFEPVGTAPDHQGKGVGTALLRFALHRLQQAGAAHAVVGARADTDYPIPRRLYQSVGFREIANQIIVRSPN